MAALGTVEQYVNQARVLLQDTVSPFRYSDADLVSGLNMAFLEARRLRPDFFLNSEIPSFEASNSTPVELDPQYRVPFVYYMVGYATLRDEEDTQDARATVFLNKFVAQLTAIA